MNTSELDFAIEILNLWSKAKLEKKKTEEKQNSLLTS